MNDSIRDELQRSIGSGYVLERELSGGGMSCVFVARDTALDRAVVIKTLPPEATAGISADRFKREIALLARLQHPHIVPILGAGTTTDGLPYYLMPFVEGESLRERLTREGELPIADTVTILREVARALAYAHERAVVHRDVKPDNVMLCRGTAMVTDFGVAKALRAASVAAGGERTPGPDATLTQIGVSLGTPAYMSPEQAAGDSSIDARADLYAFGCMAYEMLTGQLPFTASLIAALLAAHVTETPVPVEHRRSTVPPALSVLVMQCLEKRPADRPLNAGVVVRALESMFSAPKAQPQVSGSTERAPRHIRATNVRRWTPWLISGGAALLVAWSRLRPPSAERTARVARFVVSGIGDPALNGAPTITPDGQNLVFVNAVDPARALYVRPLGDLRPRMLPGTEGAAAPFVSPDGRWVGFFAGGQVKKVALDGGTPAMTLGPGPPLARGTWSTGGAIVMGGNDRSGLTWVSASGERSVVRPLTALDTSAEEGGHRAPLALPDGRTVVFTITGPSGSELAMTRLVHDDAHPARNTRLGIEGEAVAFRDGWLIVRTPRATLEAVRFDLASGHVSGAPVAVFQDPSGIERATLADDGTLVYSTAQLADSVVIVDSRGAGRSFLAAPEVRAGDPRAQFEFGVGSRHFMNPRVSPDGRRLQLLVISPQGMSVWSYDMTSGTPTRLTATELVFGSDWAPDGQQILYSTNDGKMSAVWLQPLTTLGVADKLFEAPGLIGGTLSPDGRTLVFQRVVNRLWGLWTLRLNDATRTAQPLFHETANDLMPRVSPDGHWLAYVSSGPEREAVFVRPFPGPGLPVQVSESNGTEPMWALDGRRLFYRAGRALVAASVTTSAGFIVTSRKTLFSGSFDGGMPHADYAVTPDGEHFVMVSGRSSSESVVVLNWDDELHRQLAHR